MACFHDVACVCVPEWNDATARPIPLSDQNLAATMTIISIDAGPERAGRRSDDAVGRVFTLSRSRASHSLATHVHTHTYMGCGVAFFLRRSCECRRPYARSSGVRECVLLWVFLLHSDWLPVNVVVVGCGLHTPLDSRNRPHTPARPHARRTHRRWYIGVHVFSYYEPIRPPPPVPSVHLAHRWARTLPTEAPYHSSEPTCGVRAKRKETERLRERMICVEWIVLGVVDLMTCISNTLNTFEIHFW